MQFFPFSAFINKKLIYFIELWNNEYDLYQWILTVDQKYDLITRNLQEIIGETEEIKNIMKTRPLKIYWGTACTSRIHIGYFVQMLKIADYLQAGCEVSILLADLHAYLDNMKSTLELINHRTEYYIKMIQSILIYMNIDIQRLKFIKGTSFQLTEKYTMDVYRAHSVITVKEAQHAGAEVVKQSDNPKMNGLLYPTLQALDEEYIDGGIDAETSGIDQRKIVTHSRIIMPKLGYKKRFYFMTEMVPGLRFIKKEQDVQNQTVKLNREDLGNLLELTNDDDLAECLQGIINKYNEEKELIGNIQLEKMSASNHDSKIDLLDTKNQIKTKINKCYCLPGDINDNCLMTICEKMVFPMLKYKGIDFVINRKEKFGGQIIYKNIDDLKNDFKTEKLHPGDFKLGMIDSFDLLLDPIRKSFEAPELQKLLNMAYSKN